MKVRPFFLSVSNWLWRKLMCNKIVKWKYTYPATPPLSIWLARVTSSLQTSNCHLRKPKTPHKTLPVWIPIRISTFMPVASRTCLGKRTQKKEIAQRLKSGQIVRIIFSYVERENETKIYNLCKLELTFFCLSNVFSVSLFR